MTQRDGMSGEGRSDEERRAERAERDRVRAAGERPPPSFGPSTRAARELRAAQTPPSSGPATRAGAERRVAREAADAAGLAASVPPRTAARPEPALAVGATEAARRAAAPSWTAPPTPAPAPEVSPEPRRPADREPEPQLEPADFVVAARPLRAEAAADAESELEFTPLPPPSLRRDRERDRVAKADRPRERAAKADLPRARDRARERTASSSTTRRAAPSRRAGAVLSSAMALLSTRLGLGVAAGGALVIVGGAFALGSGGEPSEQKAAAKAAEQAKKSPYGVPTPAPLPPETRIVAYTGAPQAKELGILGTMPFEQAADRLGRQAVPYDRKSRPVLPAFDLISTIADAHPGPAGKFRTRQTGAVIAKYLRAARRHDSALILDVQPGGSNFVDETNALKKWLKEPDVELALDPEWRMRPGVQPGTEIGWVSAGEITATLNVVARIIRANHLPRKTVIVHRFTDGMIRDLDTVDVPKEIVPVITVDGVGDRVNKTATYNRIAPTLPKPWLPGFKLFYEEDKAAGGMMSGKQVMALKPRPHVVLYE